MANSADAQSNSGASKSGVRYVSFTEPPAITDLKINTVINNGILPEILSAKQGSEPLVMSDVANPANFIDRRIAKSFAAKNQLTYLSDPIANSPHFGIMQDSQMRTNSSERFAVKSTFTLLYLTYAPLQWYNFDVNIIDRVRIFDTLSGKIVSQGRCFVKGDFLSHYSHDQLVENHAKLLNTVVSNRANQCVAEIDAQLGLQDTSEDSSDVRENPEVDATAEIACDADKAVAAARLGVPCSALGKALP